MHPIDFMELAVLLTTFLSPFLPHLLKFSEPVAEEAGKKLGAKLGDGSWETAKKAWSKISPKVEEKPLAKGAASALAENEQDGEAKAILIKQIEKLLAESPALSQSLQQLLADDAESVNKTMSISQTVTGDRNTVIGEASGPINISYT